MARSIQSHGNPLTLAGRELKVGDKAPDFTAVDVNMKPVKLSDFKGNVIIISAVPSLDTPVCELQTKRFNEEASKLNAKILTVSMDLPFAQARWCGAAGVTNVTTLSDHKDASFGAAYGVLIKELRLLARSVFVVDRKGELRYVELVKEITHEPDYDAALKAAKACL